MNYNDIPDVLDFLDNTPHGRAARKEMERIERIKRAKRNGQVLFDFLRNRMNHDFLRKKSHIPFLGCGSEHSNEQALEHWSIAHLRKHPDQEQHITSEFMVETLELLKETLIAIEEL
ncbi:MAG: hypothetical protein ABW090_16180 [Sedimenticola sp.]